MKQLDSETHDLNTLQELGRASVQIVHDLKNQLNGLKLYATFLRKRMEISDRPADERETIEKLIAGLDRAATDMTMLVRYGRPVELRRQTHADLVKILNRAEKGDGVLVESVGAELTGEFDVAGMTEALSTITSYSTRARSGVDSEELRIHVAPDAAGKHAIIEWRGIRLNNGDDPFQSFAGSEGLRMSLARKVIEAHGGQAEYDATILRVRLPLERPA